MLDLVGKTCHGQMLWLTWPLWQDWRKKFYNIDTWFAPPTKNLFHRRPSDPPKPIVEMEKRLSLEDVKKITEEVEVIGYQLNVKIVLWTHSLI